MLFKLSNSKSQTNPKSRLFVLELYEDNDNHINILNTLISDYSIVGIKHDRDIWEDDVFNDDNKTIKYHKGEYKKTHHHIIIKFENARYKNALANELNIEPNLISKCSSFKSYVIYMTHRDYPQKAQYDFDEFYGSLVPDALNALNELKPENEFSIICNFIYSKNGKITFREITDFVLECGYYSTYRQSFNLIKELVYEHNEHYFRTSQNH